MAIDERDYMKDRANEQFNNWKRSNRDRGGIVLKQRVATNTGSYYVPIWPFVLILAVVAGAFFYDRNNPKASNIPEKPVVTVTAPPAAPFPTPPSVMNDRASRLATAKENYWREVYSPSQECRQVRTALKDLECRNQADTARQQFERQWANKLTSGWIPRELK